MKRRRSSKKRLVLATRIFTPEPAAASFRLAAVVKSALQQRIRVTVLTTRYLNTKDTRSGNLVVSRFPVLRDRTGYVRGYLPYLSFDLPLFFRLLFTRGRIVLVEPPPTTGVMARIACALLKVPYVWYAADIWSDAAGSTGARRPVVAALRMLERFVIKGSAGTIAVSAGVAKRVQELGGKNIRIIPNGIDTVTYSPAVKAPTSAELSQLGITKPYFLYAGTASEWQRAEEFATAFISDTSLTSQAQIVFVGNGTSWAELQRMESLGSRDRYPNPLVLLDQRSSDEVARLLRGAVAALVSIAPETGYDFAYPTKVLAALSCGTPVIYAGVGPARLDVIENKFGHAVDLNSSQIQDAMRKQLAVTPSVERAERSHEWVKEHRSLQRVGNDAVDFLVETASSSSRN